MSRSLERFCYLIQCHVLHRKGSRTKLLFHLDSNVFLTFCLIIFFELGTWVFHANLKPVGNQGYFYFISAKLHVSQSHFKTLSVLLWKEEHWLGAQRSWFQFWPYLCVNCGPQFSHLWSEIGGFQTCPRLYHMYVEGFLFTSS